VDQGNRERDDDHARESEIEVHGVSIQNMRDGAILNRAHLNKKFGFMI
jgi:hypothetical protein